MKKKQSEGLIYHSLHGKDVRGCLPVFILLAFIVMIAGFFLFKIKLTEDVTPRGKGQVYLKKDPLYDTHIGKISPLPLRLPEFADPAKGIRSYATLPITRYATFEPASPIRAFDRELLGSTILNDEYLLDLPAELSPPWASQKEELPSPSSPNDETPKKKPHVL